VEELERTLADLRARQRDLEADAKRLVATGFPEMIALVRAPLPPPPLRPHRDKPASCECGLTDRAQCLPGRTTTGKGQRDRVASSLPLVSRRISEVRFVNPPTAKHDFVYVMCAFAS
jgi:hypothetical protein